jgi:hypothetical protein
VGPGPGEGGRAQNSSRQQGQAWLPQCPAALMARGPFSSQHALALAQVTLGCRLTYDDNNISSASLILLRSCLQEGHAQQGAVSLQDTEVEGGQEQGRGQEQGQRQGRGSSSRGGERPSSGRRLGGVGSASGVRAPLFAAPAQVQAQGPESQGAAPPSDPGPAAQPGKSRRGGAPLVYPEGEALAAGVAALQLGPGGPAAAHRGPRAGKGKGRRGLHAAQEQAAPVG